MNWSDTDIVLTSYAALEEVIAKFAEGHYNMIAVLGRPGTGKSEVVRNAMRESRNLYLDKAYITPYQLYGQLWHHLDQPVVLDDCDDLWRNKESNALLKALCESREVKTLSRINGKTQRVATADKDGDPAERDTPPEVYDTTSRVVILGNDLGRHSKDLCAVLDRGMSFWFNPANAQVLSYAASWFEDEEIMSFAQGNCPAIAKVSLRDLVNAKALKRAAGTELTWEGYLRSVWEVPEEALPMLKVLQDPTIRSEGERLLYWMNLTGKSRAEFYRDRAKYDPNFKPRPQKR